ncbi:MAG: sialidase family protein, partial [Verrucomicrobia bacterium]|nr:sialidase family protein [Verrucomicrobiota bacterium]
MKINSLYRWLFLCAIAALVPLLGVPVRAAQPFIEKIDLFESGKEDYALYRIPGVVVTKKGTVRAWGEARKNAKGDWGP